MTIVVGHLVHYNINVVPYGLNKHKSFGGGEQFFPSLARAYPFLQPAHILIAGVKNLISNGQLDVTVETEVDGCV